MSQNSSAQVVHTRVIPLFYWVAQGLKIMSFFGIPFGILGILNALVSKGVLTTDRIQLKYGLLSSSELDTTLDKISSVSVEQSFVGKIFNFGFVVVSSTGGEKCFMLTENPSNVKNIIFNEQEKYKDAQIKKQATAMAQAMRAA